jgi:hypothetical protein
MVQDAAASGRLAKATFGTRAVEAPVPVPVAPQPHVHDVIKKKKESPLPFIARAAVCTTLVVGALCAGARFIAVEPPVKTAMLPPSALPMPKPRLHLDWAQAVRKPLAEPSASGPVEAAQEMHNSQVRRTFLEMLTTALSSDSDVVQFGSVRLASSLVGTIVRAARETDMDPVLLMAIADKESSFQPDVGARTSSAVGLFQFVESTWLRVIRDFGPRHGLVREAALIGPGDKPNLLEPAAREKILDLRRDPYLASLMAGEMLKRDGSRIAQNIGRDLTTGEIYLAHFLGPDDAERFMEKVVGQPKYVAAKLLPRPAKANASIFYARHGRKTKPVSVAAVHDKFESMMGLRFDRYRSVGRMPGVSAYTDLNLR